MDRSNLIWGLILVAIGFLFLADNLGWMRFSFWEFLSTYWPVFVIAAGVDMLMKALGHSGREKRHTGNSPG